MVGIPIPPSLNNAYPTGRHGKRFKSSDLVKWEREFDMWAFLHMTAVKSARTQFAEITAGKYLSVSCVYYFKRERILCRNGNPKRCDVDNRLKHLLDKVSKLVGFDDSLIWQGGFYKRVTDSGTEFCSVQLRWVNPMEGN